MHNNLFLSTILSASLLGLGSDVFAQATNTTCQNAILISETNPTFPVPVNPNAQPTTNNYDCFTQINGGKKHLWFYFQIASAGLFGDLQLDITRTQGSGSSYVLYGPYSSVSSALAMCGNLGNGLDVEDCDAFMRISQSAIVSNANDGDVYVLLVAVEDFTSDRVSIARNNQNSTATMGTPSSLQENAKNSFEAKIVPNPVQNQAYLEFELAENSAETQIRIINTLGQVQYNQVLSQLNAGTHRVDLQTNLAAGTYFVEISNQNQTSRIPFVKVQ